MSDLQQLIEISRHYGDNPDYVIAGGGNTSFKNDERIWIKASGIPLAGIDENGFVCLSREKLGQIELHTYSEDPVRREEEVKVDMKKAIISPDNLRPSVETSLHNLIGYSFVIHTHPTLVNGLMCANHVREEVEERFGTDAIYVEYTDPGFILFKKLQQRIGAYQEKHGKAPQIIFLQNHGVFVGADTTGEIHSLYEFINVKIGAGKDLSIPSCEALPYESAISSALAGHFKTRGLVSKSIRCALVDHYTENLDRYLKVSLPFSPDIIVYCKSRSLFLGKDTDAGLALAACDQFEETHGYYPKVILEEQGGLITVEENMRSLDTVVEVFTDLMKISYLSDSFGGPHFMTPEQIRFIDNWEVEHYRRKVAKGTQ
jgi:rhamnose utilization protein RhaD (predicted bifunctional aldolase and dehydrogenase)